MTRDEVVTEARRWLHVPYLQRGRSRRGLDCLGLGVVVAQHFNVPHEDIPDYSDQPHPRRLLLQQLRRYLQPMPQNGDLTGCIGVFVMVAMPCHVGFFTWQKNRVHVLHARLGAGVVEEAYEPSQPGERRTEFRMIDALAFPGLAP